jgi:arabinose-5-phosphate isomerase
MHGGANVPRVAAEASMDEVIALATEKKLGAVLVVADISGASRLLGLITDGDLRRALGQRERFFQLRAREVMTASPVTTLPEALAYDALRVMENRPSQISVLPVVDAQGHWLGVLRLHDLVQLL